MKKLYVPVTVDQGVAVLRRQIPLENAARTDKHTVIAYTDRAVAVLEGRRVDSDLTEIGLLAVEIEEHLFETLLVGDWIHHGPVAHWLSDQSLELEHGAYGRFSHEAHFSLEVVKK